MGGGERGGVMSGMGIREERYGWLSGSLLVGGMRGHRKHKEGWVEWYSR